MILVGGENLIDFIQTESGGSAPVYRASPGGGPFNCAKALGRMGATVGYLTPISSDDLGCLLAEELAAADVLLVSPRRDEPSSLAVVSVASGVASYQFYREKTAERMVDLKTLLRDTPQDARALCLGSLAIADGPDADIWADYYCRLNTRGLLTCLDPNIRPAFIRNRKAYLERLDRMLAHSDIVKLSDEDLAWIEPELSIENAARKMLSGSNAKLLVVTQGAQGSTAYTGNTSVNVPAAEVAKMIDTVGAGDTFLATMMWRVSEMGALTASELAMLGQSDVQDILTWAACAAAMNCEHKGCQPPTKDELQDRMNTP